MNIDPNTIPPIEIPAGMLPVILLIAAAIAAIISTIRKLPRISQYIDLYCKELLPFVSMALGVAAARWILHMDGTNMILAGAGLGFMSTGNYEFVKMFKIPQSLVKPAATATVLLILFLTGCHKTSMPADLEQQVKSASMAISTINRKCQTVDPNACQACKDGLAAADRTLRLIVASIDDVNTVGM